MTNQSKIPKIGVDRPEQLALKTAIEDAIDQIAMGKMTHIEVIGTLHAIAHEFYFELIYGGEND